ncbi:MAG: mannose-1-phosphate guanylyltransferase [Bacteroidota bacterium]
MENNYCIIMAGGIGSRFWPMSTIDRPKQFLDILGTGQTLIQQTYKRFTKICPEKNIFIVTNDLYKNLVIQQLRINKEQVISEPSRRNTAPCIAYASYKIADINPNAIIIVAPSDHVILKEEAFTATIDLALNKARSDDCLVTLGIKPDRPDTGYGYIQFNDPEVSADRSKTPLRNRKSSSLKISLLAKNKKIRKVKTFTEKPNLQIAKKFLESGDFYWNSGIFIWTLKSILKALEKYLPEVNTLFHEGIGKYNKRGEAKFIKKTYQVCKNISIDYGVMEKADNVYVVLSNFGWTDLGTWSSLYDNLRKNRSGNAVSGEKVFIYDSKNCIVNIPDDKVVVLQGLEDYIVVESNNTLLICKKQDEQKIKQMVQDIKIRKK